MYFLKHLRLALYASTYIYGYNNSRSVKYDR